MQRVLFLVYHGAGHFNACFRLARILKSDFEVFFAGHAYFKQHVESQGFSFLPLKTVPFGLGFEGWVNAMEKKRNIFWHSLQDRRTDRLFLLREAELKESIEALSPDYLLIDSWQSTDFIVLYPLLKKKNIRTALIQTMLPIEVEPDLPPLNSAVLPGNKKFVRAAHKIFFWRTLKKSVIQKFKYLGNDNHRQIERAWKRNQIPEYYRSPKKSLFTIALGHVDEFILAPAEIDFVSAFRSEFKHYVGSMIDHARKENPSEAFTSALSRIAAKTRDDVAPPLIYCSFGTLTFEDSALIRDFLEQLIRVSTQAGYVLLISAPTDIIQRFGSLPPDVFMASHLPQLQILRRANIMITHGGLNSIKESVDAGVPLLVYPLNNNTDHFGNAARVVYHHLGLRGNLKRDSEHELVKKIKRLLTDQDFRTNILKMQHAEQRYTEYDFLERFKNIKPLI